jgi:DNA (cytosine-5)-methyltransferase 1
MSLGAIACGIDVKYAVEADLSAGLTFARNHPSTKLFNQDIRRVRGEQFRLLRKREQTVVFGGPPCQGFSTSNQSNRNLANENNWLFKEYLRIVVELLPEWVVFENVKGLIETENGYFLEAVVKGFRRAGYTTSCFVLNSADYGVPQKRNRLFIVGSLNGVELRAPIRTVQRHRTVRQALLDLPDLQNGDAPDFAHYARLPRTHYAKSMRRGLLGCWNNVVTANADHIVERYRCIPQGGNWADIPVHLMKNYADVSRCHTGIYRRLKEDEPSVVIGNFRKNMLIHPWIDRGLSVREAARLQSFPDNFRFSGSIGFQQQQVGNAVPPLLAEAVFSQINMHR